VKDALLRHGTFQASVNNRLLNTPDFIFCGWKQTHELPKLYKYVSLAAVQSVSQRTRHRFGLGISKAEALVRRLQTHVTDSGELWGKGMREQISPSHFRGLAASFCQPKAAWDHDQVLFPTLCHTTHDGRALEFRVFRADDNWLASAHAGSTRDCQYWLVELAQEAAMNYALAMPLVGLTGKNGKSCHVELAQSMTLAD